MTHEGHVIPVRGGHGEYGADGNESIAATVRAFYERHPYPAPPEDLDAYRTRMNDDRVRVTEHRLFWPNLTLRDNFSVLIAGCGTVQAVKHAMRWPNAHIVGIDVSEASIERTAALKERYGLKNLELACLPVEQAGRLHQRFDQIICTGVLHHLPDPDVGLLALREVLAPGGAMHLMLYAPYGRTGIYLLQDYCRRLGIGSSLTDIHELDAALRQLPQGHALWPLLKASPDFRYEAGLADALLHPRDRPYSVPEFFEFVKRGGLRFGRWLRQAPYLPHCGAPSKTPHYGRLAKLGGVEQYAAMELFRGNMVRHSAILYRDDEQTANQTINFAGESWLDYRPVRLPETVCVEEQLPPGAAGVLINRRHIDKDIYLPINSVEKQLVLAIDGVRSVRDLMKAYGHRQPLKMLFQRLWWYDQIVFDTSNL
ncbi:class I SAM-dependent methyltransferase [Aquamicrobium terrae]|uniref:SAM-dependent methyltransferase n=1 Tax=Aquamicrobium terrae TaxID=1324945 RepID=A0ABV2N624_9HYPH